MMRDRIVILGTGTCQILPHRLPSSILIELTHLRLLYDIGPGILGRLCKSGLKQDDICHIILSHFHPDHVTDLILCCRPRVGPKRIPAQRIFIFTGQRVSMNFLQRCSIFFRPGPFNATGSPFISMSVSKTPYILKE